MNKLKDSELILTSSGRIYHLNLKEEEVSDNIILVGDPERVKQISQKFDSIEFTIQHREFITHTGTFNKKKITVISTGIGADNIDIVINELDAVKNIDFNRRKIKENRKKLNIIRLGTSGSLSKSISVDDFVVSSYALGFDGLPYFYKDNSRLIKEAAQEFIQHTNWDVKHAMPYVIKASNSLFKNFSDFKHGITATATGFYGPQSREIFLESSIKDFQKKIENYKYENEIITNFEMETSALYFLGQTLGHNTLTVCAILGNRINQSYSKTPMKTINKLIDKVLERI